MVCSCIVPFKRVLLQIILCSCVIGTTLLREKWQIASLSCQEVIKICEQTWWSNDKTIIELGYHKISWFVSLRLRQITDLLATDKSWYFCQRTSPKNCYFYVRQRLKIIRPIVSEQQNRLYLANKVQYFKALSRTAITWWQFTLLSDFSVYS